VASYRIKLPKKETFIITVIMMMVLMIIINHQCQYEYD